MPGYSGTIYIIIIIIIIIIFFFLHLSHLADALIQSDLQEQLELSTLLKGTLTDFSPSQLEVSNQQPFGYWPNALNR